MLAARAGFLLLGIGVHSALADAPPSQLVAPYHVGVTTLRVRPSAGRPMTVEVWYPTEAPGLPTPPYESGAPSEASRNVPVAKGMFPIILFSHGFSGVREQSIFLTEFWAKWGYVVIAPDHPGSGGRDLRLLQADLFTKNQPRDLTYALDALLQLNQQQTGLFAGRLQAGRIASTGHSLGGYSALAVGGALLRERRHLGEPRNAPPVYTDLTDPRVRAVIALAPVTKPMFDDHSLAHIHLPVLVVGGNRDSVTPFALQQHPLLTGLVHAPRFVARLQGATHFNFNDDEITRRSPSLIRRMDQPRIDRSLANPLLQDLTLAFLDQYLMGNDRWNDILEGTPPWLTVESAFPADP